MTPEQMDEINRIAKGDPMVIGQELVKIVNEQEAEIARLTDRVIAESTNRVDGADLKRENDELRKRLADAPTGEAAIAKLREWSASAGPEREWAPGASFIGMSTAMARKILDEIDRLTRQRNAATAATDRVADRAIHLRAERNQARAHLHRLVDHQDDECAFDHHGTCQAHFVDGSEPGKCGVVEARQFLAQAEGATPDVDEPRTAAS